MKYEMIVANEEELINRISHNYPFLNETYIHGMLNLILSNVKFTISFLEDEDKEAKIYDDESEDKNMNKNIQEEQSINVLQYMTEDNMNNFIKVMQDSLYERINRDRKSNKIPYEDLLTTYRYRSSYIEYGLMYKNIINNSKYDSRDHILLTKFFINGIYSNEAWHQQRDNSRIFLLRAKGASAVSLLDYDTYTKDILMVHVYDTLLKGMPSYTITDADMQKINQYLYNIMHPYNIQYGGE